MKIFSSKQILFFIERKVLRNFPVLLSGTHLKMYPSKDSLDFELIEIFNKGIMVELLEEEDHEQDHECSICGKINDHELSCPDNHSPFANLIRDGYD